MVPTSRLQLHASILYPTGAHLCQAASSLPVPIPQAIPWHSLAALTSAGLNQMVSRAPPRRPQGGSGTHSCSMLASSQRSPPPSSLLMHLAPALSPEANLMAESATRSSSDTKPPPKLLFTWWVGMVRCKGEGRVRGMSRTGQAEQHAAGEGQPRCSGELLWQTACSGLAANPVPPGSPQRGWAVAAAGGAVLGTLAPHPMHPASQPAERGLQECGMSTLCGRPRGHATPCRPAATGDMALLAPDAAYLKVGHCKVGAGVGSCGVQWKAGHLLRRERRVGTGTLWAEVGPAKRPAAPLQTDHAVAVRRPRPTNELSCRPCGCSTCSRCSDRIPLAVRRYAAATELRDGVRSQSLPKPQGQCPARPPYAGPFTQVASSVSK